MSEARATLPLLPPPSTPRLPPFHAYRLPNGLELLVIERRGLPVIDVRLLVRAGALYDAPAIAGRAYLTADLLDQGTATRTAVQIADEAEYLGATLHTRASWDYAVAGLHVLSTRMEPGFELLADVILNASFPEAEVSRKRAERLAAIRQELDEPRVLASQAFARQLYGAEHPFGAPAGGTRHSVAALQADDLRRFYHQLYAPANAFIVIAGDIDVEHALRLIERLFGDWSRPQRSAGQPIQLADVQADSKSGGDPFDAQRAGWHARPKAAPQARSIHIVDRPGAPQSELRVGLPGPPRNTPDYFPLLVGNVVLGGAFTSRLNMRLREEKAYTYGAGSQFAFRTAGGPFLASTAVFTGATADAVNDIVQEIARLGSEPIDAVELERAQNNLVLGMPRTFETTADIAEHVSELVLYELDRDFFDRYGTNVHAVTAEQVWHAASRWLPPEQLQIVVVGDASVIESDLKSLDLGTVEVTHVS